MHYSDSFIVKKSLLHNTLYAGTVYWVSQKVAPNVFVNFSEMRWNFNTKFYKFIQSVHVRFCAK